MNKDKNLFEKGLENGMKLGEMNTKVIIARKMIKFGYDIKEINKIIDLPLNVIKDLTK